jgi:hypothetical protein
MGPTSSGRWLLVKASSQVGVGNPQSRERGGKREHRHLCLMIKALVGTDLALPYLLLSPVAACGPGTHP